MVTRRMNKSVYYLHNLQNMVIIYVHIQVFVQFFGAQFLVLIYASAKFCYLLANEVAKGYSNATVLP